jgi:hypothetical protein
VLPLLLALLLLIFFTPSASAKDKTAAKKQSQVVQPAKSGDGNFPSPWPRIISGASNPDCKIALRFAKMAFRSHVPHIEEQYERLWCLYPKSSEQLTAYYEMTFHQSHDRAAALAKKNMDLALRSNFNY